MKEREYRAHKKELKDKMGQIVGILLPKFLRGKWKKNIDTRKGEEIYLLNILSSAILKAPIPSRFKGNAPYAKIQQSHSQFYWQEIIGEKGNNGRCK